MSTPINLRTLSKLGVTPEMPEILRRQVILGNQLVMVATPIVLMLIVNETVLRWHPIKAAMIALLLAVFLAAMRLNAIGKNTYSRVLLCLFLPLYLLVLDIVSKLVNPEFVYVTSYFGDRLFLLATFCFPLLLFDSNEEPYAFWGLVQVNILVLASYDYLHGLFGIDIYRSGLREQLKGYHVINYTFLISAISTIMSVLFLRSLNKQYQGHLLHENKKLDEENIQIDQQNRQLENQKLEISTRRDAIQERNELVSQQNQQIEMSIAAAQRIQEAQLPSKKKLDEVLDQYFIFDRPKDTVSGDFYWIGTEGDVNILMVGDCTGHGVAGAFMTVIATTLLDKIVHFQKVTDPSEILEQLDHEIKVALKQEETGNSNGLEGTVIAWKNPVNIIAASAKSSFHTVKDGIPTEHKGTRRSIGGNALIKRGFENIYLELEYGNHIFLYSDGYIDQNDPARSRFGKASFQNLLKMLAMLPYGAQEETASSMLDQHKAGSVQRDDITILGFKI